MARSAPLLSFSPVSSRMMASRLGTPAVVFFVMPAAAPLAYIAAVVTTGHATGVTGIPVAFVMLAGVGWALLLKRTRPRIYDRIGMGAKAATIGDLGAGVPGQRTPGGLSGVLDREQVR